MSKREMPGVSDQIVCESIDSKCLKQACTLGYGVSGAVRVERMRSDHEWGWVPCVEGDDSVASRATLCMYSWLLFPVGS